MAFSRVHALVMTTPDDPAYECKPSDWNDGHDVSGADVGGIPYCPTATTETTSANLTYTETSGPRLQVGSGSATSAGIIIGYGGASGYSGIWPTTVTPTVSNYSVLIGGGDKITFGSPSTANDAFAWSIHGVGTKAKLSGTAGEGFILSTGTATTAVSALSATQTWNAAGVTFTGIKYTITDTASAAGSLAMQILGGASGTTNLISVSKGGNLSVGGNISGGEIGASGLLYAGSGNGAAAFKQNSTNNILLDTYTTGSLGRVQWGGTTSSFPAIKRNSAVLEARLADDSAAATWQGTYNSSDGTAGVASFGPSAVTSITIKDGIVTAIS